MIVDKTGEICRDLDNCQFGDGKVMVKLLKYMIPQLVKWYNDQFCSDDIRCYVEA